MWNLEGKKHRQKTRNLISENGWCTANLQTLRRGKLGRWDRRHCNWEKNRLNAVLMHCLVSSKAAAAKSLQSCPTLWDTIDGSSPGSPVPGDEKSKSLFSFLAISDFHSSTEEKKYQERKFSYLKSDISIRMGIEGIVLVKNTFHF